MGVRSAAVATGRSSVRDLWKRARRRAGRPLRRWARPAGQNPAARPTKARVTPSPAPGPETAGAAPPPEPAPAEPWLTADRSDAARRWVDEIGQRFEVDRTVVAKVPGHLTRSSQEQFKAWTRWRRDPESVKQLMLAEYLLPRIVRRFERSWPSYMEHTPGHADRSREELLALVTRLGPWRVPFQLAHGLTTTNFGDFRDGVLRQRYLFRREVITGTVAELLGERLADTTVLDVGCNAGFFSLDLAARGAKHVHGIDLRPENIAQAQFLKDHYGIDNVSFAVSDADDLPNDQWDVVLNLGVLYHVTAPLQFLHQTFNLCRGFAVVDTNCHTEPVSAYFVLSDKNVDRPTEGREPYELHPTYRGAIETLGYAGFSAAYDVVGITESPHDKYALGHRRCLVAVK